MSGDGPSVIDDARNTVIDDEASAKEVADLIISLAGMHVNSVASLGEFWKKNIKPIDVLDTKFPDQYERVRAAFSDLKTKLSQEQ
jgi:hypothetical protein